MKEKLKEIKQRIEHISVFTLPWTHRKLPDGSYIVEAAEKHEGFNYIICETKVWENKAAFIAQAPQDILDLIEMVEEAEARADEWEKLAIDRDKKLQEIKFDVEMLNDKLKTAEKFHKKSKNESDYECSPEDILELLTEYTKLKAAVIAGHYCGVCSKYNIDCSYTLILCNKFEFNEEKYGGADDEISYITDDFKKPEDIEAKQ